LSREIFLLGERGKNFFCISENTRSKRFVFEEENGDYSRKKER